MHERKQHVIKKAYELFIEKGFQATSIQEILDDSGISKGTFYNYFSSKNELFIALLSSLSKEIENERNELLLGHDPSDIHIFMRQIELQLKTNRKNKLLPLYEEVIVSNDRELKTFMQENYLLTLRWYYDRFIDLFGKDKEPYLYDCAIMFMGILQQNLRFYSKVYKGDAGIHEVVRYSVSRLIKIVEDVSTSRDQLIDPEHFENLMPHSKVKEDSYKITQSISHIKKLVRSHEEEENFNELLHFIQEELLHTKNPRKFLLKSSFAPLKTAFPDKEELLILQDIIDDL